MNPDMFEVRIVMRDGQGQTKDDYHATVTRERDGTQLIFISDYRWLLKWKLRKPALRRAFRRCDRDFEKQRDAEERYRV